MKAVHPGEVLRKQFMEPAGLSARALSREIMMPSHVCISAIIKGMRSVTPKLAVLFGLRFGTTAEFWMDMQIACDVEKALAGLTQKRGALLRAA